MTDQRRQLGVHVDDLRLDAKRGLQTAAQLGFGAVQADAARGELSPEQLSASGRRHLLRFTAGLGLQMAGLRADMGGRRFLDPAMVERHIDQTRTILHMARDLQVKVVSAPIGRFDAENPEEYAAVRVAMERVAAEADLLDRFYAIETAVTSAPGLQQLLHDLACPNIKIAYDPAELLMDGLNPLAPIELFADDIAVSVARDGQLGNRDQPGRETNLGAGQLNVGAYLNLLAEAGYKNPLVLRRAHSEHPLADLRASKEHLEGLLQSGAAL